MRIHQDQRPYLKFTTKARLDKSINSLLGLIEGIAVDSEINSKEVEFLNLWLADHHEVKNLHPYTELYPVVAQAIADGVLTSDEKDDILWLCEQFSSTKYYDFVTADMQRLHAALAGVGSDGAVTSQELRGLSGWLEEHEHLRTCWPYDEVDSLIVGVLKDGRIDDTEHQLLTEFTSEFVSVLDDRTITQPKILVGGTLVGLCAVQPQLTIQGRTFCFTGASGRHTREELNQIVEKAGGRVLSSVSARLDYLIIGSDGNPCWAYACYGRKVEKAVEMRKGGARLLIVHEHDFHDAIADQ